MPIPQRPRPADVNTPAPPEQARALKRRIDLDHQQKGFRVSNPPPKAATRRPPG